MTTYQTTALIGPAITRPVTAQAPVGLLQLHWFRQLRRICNIVDPAQDDGTIYNPDNTPWKGGDIKAFVAEIPQVLQEKRQTGELDPRSRILVANVNEHQNTPLDDSWTAYLWMKYFAQAIHESTGMPLGCYSPFRAGTVDQVWHHHSLFQFLCPSLYPYPCKVREQPGPTGEGSYDWYVNTICLPRLAACANTGQSLISFCTRSYFKTGDFVEPWVWSLQVGMARRFGDVTVYAEVKDQAEMDAQAAFLGQVAATEAPPVTA